MENAVQYASRVRRRCSGRELRAMAVEFPEVNGHPNRLPFEGCLTLVDVPSDKAPSGARGHRVVLTREAAEMALPSLLGMAVDYKAGGMDMMRGRSAASSRRLTWREAAAGGWLPVRAGLSGDGGARWAVLRPEPIARWV